MKFIATWTSHETTCGCIYEGSRHVHGILDYVRTGEFDGLNAEIDVPDDTPEAVVAPVRAA